ncbi:MAG: hypothetical protein IT249_14595 [Chitinophagaceae bacterium]|nr:hypothetical protein [Chitinophagaceae bacterium]
MKIIISHDVDHYSWSDHLLKDLFIPKFIVRNNIHFLKGKISAAEYFGRYATMLNNRQHRLTELTKFNNRHNIPATFFIGMRNALNLSYNYKNAGRIVEIIKQGSPDAEIGVHGIAYNNMEQMKEEYERMKKLIGSSLNGIRMHYLRNDAGTLGFLNEIGYRYDSTTYDLKNPYKVGNLVEFPASIMDVSVIGTRSFDQIKDLTLQHLETAKENKLDFFTVIFHDVYFDDVFKNSKNWYIWLIEYLKSQNFEFTNFENAIASCS